MKQVLSQINDVIESLEEKGQIVEAAKLDNVFVRIAQQAALQPFENVFKAAELWSLSVMLPKFHKANVSKNGQPGLIDKRFIDERYMPSKAYWQAVQNLLGIAADGIPGKNTFAAIQSFIANNKNADDILEKKLNNIKVSPAQSPKDNYLNRIPAKGDLGTGP
jgi:hypothetical protein